MKHWEVYPEVSGEDNLVIFSVSFAGVNAHLVLVLAPKSGALEHVNFLTHWMLLLLLYYYSFLCPIHTADVDVTELLS